jgi:hypothetical protein
MNQTNSSDVLNYRNRLEAASGYAEVWELVKDTVKFSMEKRRDKMMLFLDDLPIQLGAYHSIGTNNIVLNRTLVQIVEVTIKSKRVVNALIYNLLLHEYMHALGEYSEEEVKRLVYEVAKQCFGEKHTAAIIAKKTPWALLNGIPLEAINAPRRAMEIVKNFEKTDKYIV